MKQERVLRRLLQYYHMQHRVGHTQLLRDGLDDWDRAGILLTGNRRQGEGIVGRRGRFLVMQWPIDEHQLEGLALPIAVDNSAMMLILRDALNIIDAQKVAIESLRQSLEAAS